MTENGFRSKRKASNQWFGAKLRDAVETFPNCGTPRVSAAQYKQEDSGLKLNPRWVEQLMGVPSNWVKLNDSTNRIDELRMLGNGVVPQTAAKAFITLNLNER